MMKKFVFIALLALPALLKAQYSELGLLFGVSQYAGDLTEDFGNFTRESHAAFGIFYRYNMTQNISARLHFNYGKISGFDSKAKDASRLMRNQHFKSNVFDFGLTGEFNVLGYEPYALAQVFSPYLFAGVGGFHFNPKTEYQDEWIALQPLATEGQGLALYPDRKTYKKLQLSIPFGIGVKYAISDLWNIGFEFGARKTFTDYIDDTSLTYADYNAISAANGEVAAALSNRTGEVRTIDDLRGTSDKKDWIFISGLTLSYNFLDNGLVGGRNRNRGGNGCYN